MQPSKVCTPTSRCRLYRVCEPCARARQAHVANLAEQLLSKYPAVFMARFTPYNNNKNEIERLKAAIKRQLSDVDAIWSIEIGQEQQLLHINLLSPCESVRPLKGAQYWQGAQVENIRRAAAYMVKRSQIPDIEVYQGRQFGSFQNLKQLMQDSKQLPTIQAAYHEKVTLMGMMLPEPYIARQAAIAKMRQEQRDYKTIANEHLHKLRTFTAAIKGTVKQ